MVKLILVCVVGLFTIINKVNAQCTCHTTSFASCINETAFRVCFDGTTASTVEGDCGPGNVCTTEAGICRPAADATAACPNQSDCNRCITGTPFACVSATEFAACNAALVPGTFWIPCPPQTYCNIESFNTIANGVRGPLCVSSCQDEPTCPVGDPAEDYTKSCVGVTASATGYYPNKADPTCKTYVYCELTDKMYSIKYTCSTGYFSKEQKTCVATKPSYCT